ncbi:MAG: hypothetical protein CSA50_02600 [Gammaproteobacteria bacterium]|nr:MAG: hypothetical protein CSA50_02600 [Gammaproteobacteria bacterium]
MITTSNKLSTTFKKLVDGLKQDIFETWCCLCDEKHHNAIAFCSGCLSDLPWRRFHATITNNITPLPDCPVTTLFDYQFPINTMLRQFKYFGKTQWGDALCDLIRPEAGTRFPSHFADLDIIVPVPLGQKRLKARGFNQSDAIAQAVSSLLKIPVEHDYCVKTKETKPQAELGRRQRQTNLAGAFKITKEGKAAITGKHLLVVDDVTTTGATFMTIKNLLVDHGARQVSGFCLAHTPA